MASIETVGEVFDEVYERAQNVVQELDGRYTQTSRPGVYVERRRKLLGSYFHRGFGYEPVGAGMTATDIVAVRSKVGRQDLFTLRGSTDIEEHPLAVSGFSEKEPGDYYWLAQEGTGEVYARVGNPLTLLVNGALEEPLFGTSKFSNPNRRKLRNLEPQDLGRLMTARQGVLVNIAAAELLLRS